MSRSTSAFAIMAVVVIGLAIVPIGAIASDHDEHENGSTTELEGDDETEIVSEVDESLRVVSWRYSTERERFTLTLENVGDGRSHVTITEMIQARDASSGTFGVEQLTVYPGESASVSVDAKMSSRSAGVMIVTERSLSRGQGTFVQYDEAVITPIFDDRPTWWFARVAGFGGALGAALIGVMLAWHRISDRSDLAEVKL